MALAEAIVGHLVGDYLLQNDWQAIGKKRSSFVCAIHSALWAAAVCLLGQLGWVAALILFVEHFVQDRWQLIPWWMDLVGQKSFRENLGPWSAIVVDNVFHILAIYLVITLL